MFCPALSSRMLCSHVCRLYPASCNGYPYHAASKMAVKAAMLKYQSVCLQSGMVLGGSAILSAVNGVTPHIAGAVDVMVVQQPDGTFKSSPFYGKQTPGLL